MLTHSSSVFILICTLWHGAGGSFWEHGGKRKRKGFLGLFCGMGERTLHTHDTNMEGRKEHGGKEGKERTMEGEEKKNAKIFQSSPKAGVRQVHVCVCICISRVEITIY